MVAIITGATGGIGEEFVRALIDEVGQIWAVGRSDDKLALLQEKYGEKVVPCKADLSNKDDIFDLCKKIENDKPQIKYLVNNAGIAKMAPIADFTLEEISDTIEINAKAATLISRAAIPFMTSGSFILNISSASSFQPNPYIALYSASKSYLLSFTRSLNFELKDVTCTAVCPGWVDTKMLIKMSGGKKVDYPGIVPASRVVQTALSDAKKGKDVSVCSGYNKFLRFYSKIMPHKIVMKQWVRGIRKYL